MPVKHTAKEGGIFKNGRKRGKGMGLVADEEKTGDLYGNLFDTQGITEQNLKSKSEFRVKIVLFESQMEDIG